MAEKTYRPKSGSEGVAVEAMLERSIVAYKDADGKRVSLDNQEATAQGLEPVFDRQEGETFAVSASDWPYSTDNPAEQAFLDSQPMLTDKAPPSSSKGDS